MFSPILFSQNLLCDMSNIKLNSPLDLSILLSPFSKSASIRSAISLVAKPVRCNEDRQPLHCPKHRRSNSREAVVVGCHGRPCSTGLRLKSPCGMSDSTLSPIYPPFLCDSHTHTQAMHTRAHSSRWCALQRLSPSATSVPCPLRKR